MLEPLATKAAARDVAFDGPGDFLDPRVLHVSRDSWTVRLASVVPRLPDFNDAVAALQASIGVVFAVDPPIVRLEDIDHDPH